VTQHKPQILLLSLAVTLALSACNRGDKPAADVDDPAKTSTAPASLTLDESKLPPVNRFTVADVDTSKNACADFGGYVNGKWLAASQIPGDRTSWGAFEMLDERSTAVQRQLAEQAAAMANPSGVEKIVGDFWSTGMDQAKIDAQGLEPLKSRLDAIAALAGMEQIAEYLRSSAAKGENVLFYFASDPDFKNSTTNIAYAFQGGLGLPDKEYYQKAEHKDKLKAYEAHVAKVLELSGVVTPCDSKNLVHGKLGASLSASAGETGW